MADGVGKQSLSLCPGCNAQLALEAILCLLCGYQTQRGNCLGAIVDHSNVYRDGEWLVVPTEGAVFPNRCVKSNQPVANPTFSYQADLLWNHIQLAESSNQRAATVAAMALFGAAGGAMLDVARKFRLSYQVGLSEELQAVARRRRHVGLSVVCAAPILAICLAYAVGASQSFRPDSFPFVVAAIIVGLLPMAGGVVWFGKSSLILHPLRSDGQYVWLGGAHPEFLATLPESPEKWVPPTPWEKGMLPRMSRPSSPTRRSPIRQ